MFYTSITTPLVPLLLLSNGQAITGIFFEHQKYFPSIENDWQNAPELPIFQQAQVALQHYFSGTQKKLIVPITLTQGTPFQQKVWNALLSIEYGKTISYSGLAKLIGSPQSTRAVAAAVGKNPISILIPCHRVIGANGSLTGYAAGIEIKAALLQLEQK